MGNYFKKVKQIIKEKGIIDLNIQNINTTSFQINSEKSQLIVIIEPNKLFHIIDPNNRDYITSVKCIVSTSETISPMLLISGVNILHKWCQHNDLDGNVVIGTTETGYVMMTLRWNGFSILLITHKTRGEVLDFFLLQMVMAHI